MMMEKSDVNYLEALRIAIDLEKEGYRFYEMLLEKSNDGKVKDAFKYLADKEKEHIELFENLYHMSEDTPMSEEVFLNRSAGENLRKIAALEVFPIEEAEALTEKADEFDVLKIGMKVEERTIQFFSELIKEDKNEERRRTFEVLLMEEEEHLKTLKDVHESLGLILGGQA